MRLQRESNSIAVLAEMLHSLSRNCSPLDAKRKKKMRMTSVTLDPTKAGAERMRPFMTSAQLPLYAKRRTKKGNLTGNRSGERFNQDGRQMAHRMRDNSEGND